MPYEARLTLFIVISVFLGVLFLLWFFYSPIKRKIYAHKPTYLFYKKIRRYVLDNDFYLINELAIKEGDYEITIDHIIGGNKYLYLIFDLYCEGGISLNPDDNKWIIYDKKGKRYMDNPLNTADLILNKLSAKSGVDASLMIAIVLVNDDCFLTPYQNHKVSPLLVPLSRLKETIEKYEKSDINNLESDQLFRTIRDFYAYYKRESHV